MLLRLCIFKKLKFYLKLVYIYLYNLIYIFVGLKMNFNFINYMILDIIYVFIIKVISFRIYVLIFL